MKHSEDSDALARPLEGAESDRARELLRVNLDVMRAVIKTRTAIAKVRRLLPQIVERLPSFDPTLLDRLEGHAAALAEAETQHRSQRKTRHGRDASVKEGLQLRSLLLAELRAQEARRRISAKSAAKLKGGNSYRNIASDLTLLVATLRAHWDKVGQNSTAQLEELARAELVVDQLIELAGQRLNPKPAAVAAATARRRAFTTFWQDYTELRRAVHYVRFYEGDANAIVPPLTGSRKSSKTRARGRTRPTERDGKSSASTQERRGAASSPTSDEELPTESAPRAFFPGFDPFVN